jgi:hypothetical protein
MAFIRVISPGSATGETKEVYNYMADVAGGFDMVAKIVQMFSLRAGSMQRMIRSWELAMWCGEEPRSNREFLASAVSRFNDCHY